MLFTGLLLIASTMWAMAQPAPTIEPAKNVDEAKALLLESWKNMNHKEYEQAIMPLKRVAAFDPGFEADFPEKKVRFHVMADLACVYMQIEDWESALCALELAEQYARERYSEPTTLPRYMDQCRKKLEEIGKPDAVPVILGRTKPLTEGGTTGKELILVPVAQLTKLFGVQVKQDGNRLVLTGMGTDAKSLTLEVGSKTAVSGSTSISLPVSPVLHDKSVLVPLRVVAEHLSTREAKKTP